MESAFIFFPPKSNELYHATAGTKQQKDPSQWARGSPRSGPALPSSRGFAPAVARSRRKGSNSMHSNWMSARAPVYAGEPATMGITMLKQALLVTTALVVCVSTAFARQESGTRADTGFGFSASRGFLAAARVAYHFWPRTGSKVLYDQSATSGFSRSAVMANNDYTGSGGCCSQIEIAADDFVIPGTGTHRITAVHAPGVLSGNEPYAMAVTFYDKIKYSEKSGITAVVLKAMCPQAPYSDLDHKGDMLVDVSSCNLGKFKAGHDYAVAVQGNSYYGDVWAWRTNRNQIKRQAFYFSYGWERGSCKTQFTPIKTCFPGNGYGPDLAFAIIGK
jgi:hypothetical protein